MEATPEHLNSPQKSVLTTLKRLEDGHHVRIATVGKAGVRAWEIS
jgi:hypothetical protein